MTINPTNQLIKTHNIVPMLRIFNGITSEITKNGNDVTPIPWIKIAKEKLASGTQWKPLELMFKVAR